MNMYRKQTIITRERLYLMEIFAATFTIAAEIHMREEATKQMSVCLGAVVAHKLGTQDKQGSFKTWPTKGDSAGLSVISFITH